MLITFKKDEFVIVTVQKIKRTTIRADKNNRWKPGNSIQFWRGNPRNVNSKRKPFEFAKGTCTEVNEIYIEPQKNYVIIRIDGEYRLLKSPIELLDLAKDDGFKSWAEMKEFFPKPFLGKLITWEITEIHFKEIEKHLNTLRPSSLELQTS